MTTHTPFFFFAFYRNPIEITTDPYPYPPISRRKGHERNEVRCSVLGFLRAFSNRSGRVRRGVEPSGTFDRYVPDGTNGDGRSHFFCRVPFCAGGFSGGGGAEFHIDNILSRLFFLSSPTTNEIIFFSLEFIFSLSFLYPSVRTSVLLRRNRKKICKKKFVKKKEDSALRSTPISSTFPIR